MTNKLYLCRIKTIYGKIVKDMNIKKLGTNGAPTTLTAFNTVANEQAELLRRAHSAMVMFGVIDRKLEDVHKFFAALGVTVPPESSETIIAPLNFQRESDVLVVPAGFSNPQETRYRLAYAYVQQVEGTKPETGTASFELFKLGADDTREQSMGKLAVTRSAYVATGLDFDDNAKQISSESGRDIIREFVLTLLSKEPGLYLQAREACRRAFSMNLPSLGADGRPERVATRGATTTRLAHSAP